MIPKEGKLLSLCSRWPVRGCIRYPQGTRTAMMLIFWESTLLCVLAHFSRLASFSALGRGLKLY